jgi:SAM-dependent methyltransferase
MNLLAHAVRLDNLRHEVRLGISTRGVVGVEHPDAAYYATMSYPAIRRALRGLALGPGDVFVDIGCGKGRVLCCAARRPVAHVIGVDVSAPLCAAAEVNALRLRGRRAPITVHNVDARAFDYARGTAFFLFNPFGADTLDRVLTKIRDDVGGRPVRLAYAVPTHRDVVDTHGWLEPWPSPAAADWLAFYRARTGLVGAVA